MVVLGASVRPPISAIVLIVAIAVLATPFVQAAGLLGLAVLLIAIATIEVVVLVTSLTTSRPQSADLIRLIPPRLVWAALVAAARYAVFALLTLGIGNAFARLPAIGSLSPVGIGFLLGFFVSAAILGRMVLAMPFVVARSETAWIAIWNSWQATKRSWPQAAVLGLVLLLLTIAYTGALQTVDFAIAAITIGAVSALAASVEAGTYRAMFT
jgi:hypothetical protein